MGITLADDRCVNVNDILSLSALHLVDINGNSMRNLIIERMQCLLTDDLRNNSALRLVGDRILIIELRSIRQIFENHVNDRVQILCTKCRSRDNLRKIIHFAVCVNIFHDFFTVYGIHFIDDQNDRCFYFFQLLDNVLLAGSDKIRRFHKP